jgi:acyl-lipid (8-3)-desaturase
MAPNPVVTPAASKAQAIRSYTLDEISKHTTSEDCWLLIRNKVYDVTNFVPNHPGGELILLQPGGDVTSLFESSHPLAVRQILSKYQVGVLAESEKTKVRSPPPS